MAPSHPLPFHIHLHKRIPCTADTQCGTANATLNEVTRACAADGTCAVTCVAGYTACAYNWCSNDPAGCAAATPLPGQGPGYNADGSPVVAAPTSATPSPSPASLEISTSTSPAVDSSTSAPVDSSPTSSAIPTSDVPAPVSTSQQLPSSTSAAPSTSSSASGTQSAQVAAAALGATSTAQAMTKPGEEGFHLSFTLIFGIVLAIGVAVTAAVFIYFRVRATRRRRAAAEREKRETMHRRAIEAEEMDKYSHFGPGGTLVSPSTLKRKPVEVTAPVVASAYESGSWADGAALEELGVRHGVFSVGDGTPASGIPETDVSEYVAMAPAGYSGSGSGSLGRGRARGREEQVEEYDMGERDREQEAWAAQHAQVQNYEMQSTYLLDNPPSANAEFQWRG
ncbi:hypothetical protein M427DRAFT_55406 [Gonapodya prolifera JEL478]|uniref:Uncharacterized protein n=1 Tax=Gonapodya prolifera (strain JEL478) TaxID=1344416 RepID=A0A139AI75_GONPJ|nr:hypothetical protein M427DRAFT_55406 [Gonapodya prolifera JEL478]|eukprot:KXS16448.1 hypothetical protein M427DRAFT_55406 [Gonapodya prolifera JEL478]